MKKILNTKKIGRAAETRAARFLCQKGYRLRAKNVLTPRGELDLVVQKEKEIVFVEVKYRSSLHGGYPAEAVDFRKMHALQFAARWYCSRCALHDAYNFRFDIIEVLPNGMLTWLQDVFSGGLV